MNETVFYHAGCPVCVSAKTQFTAALDPTQIHFEIVHLGESKERLVEAEQVGVKSAPTT
jgi:glutaredoxin